MTIQHPSFFFFEFKHLLSPFDIISFYIHIPLILIHLFSKLEDLPWSVFSLSAFDTFNRHPLHFQLSYKFQLHAMNLSLFKHIFHTYLIVSKLQKSFISILSSSHISFSASIVFWPVVAHPSFLSFIFHDLNI